MEAERAHPGGRRSASRPRPPAGGPAARAAPLGRIAALARLSAVAVAALLWSAFAILFADAAGLLPRDAPPTVASDAPSDPCALREPLPTGNDSQCTFDLERTDGRPLVVDLDQRWSGNVLTQWLNVREPGHLGPVHFVFARSAGVPQPTRILRLFSVRAADGSAHLVYVVGRCGGTVCGTADLIAVVPATPQARTVLSYRLGRLADVELRERALVALEGSFPDGAQRPDALVARTFAWDGRAYALRAVARLPPPSPTPSPR